MIAFKKMSIAQRLLVKFIPFYQKKYERELKEAIRVLIEHPEMPCVIDSHFIPDGYGSPIGSFLW